MSERKPSPQAAAAGAEPGARPRAAPWLTRRTVLRGALGLGVVAAIGEVASLRGAFDQRRLAVGEGAERFERAMQTAAAHDGLLHLAHSTHVLCVGGLRLLTDPWFYDPAFGALEHAVKPPVAPDQLSGIDAVLISHDHPDHADLRALDRMEKRCTVVCPTTELAARVKALGFEHAPVLRPWESMQLGALTLTATPAEHDVYEIGFVVQSAAFSVYFAGDTRLCPAIEEIAERFGGLDLAVLPVDGTRVAGAQLWVMTPEHAAQAAQTLRARAVVPSHAEAQFSDPLVKRWLARDVPDAAAEFARQLAAAAPHIACSRPAPGELVAFG